MMLDGLLKSKEDFHHWCGNDVLSVAATYDGQSQFYDPGAPVTALSPRKV